MDPIEKKRQRKEVMDPANWILPKGPNSAVIVQLGYTYLASIKLNNFFMITVLIRFILCSIFLGIFFYELILNRSGTPEKLIAGVLVGYFIVDISIIVVAVISDEYCSHLGDQSKNFKVFTVLIVFLGILLLIFTILPHVLNNGESGNIGYKTFQYTILATCVFTPLSIIFLIIHIVYLNKLCNHMKNYLPLRQKAIELGIELPPGA